MRRADFIEKGILSALEGGFSGNILCLMKDLGRVWDDVNATPPMFFYHKDSEEIYGPGKLSGAYVYFREKYPHLESMTPDSFIIAPNLAEIYKVVRAE